MTGSKAPQLKRLGQWLLENPMFDVDPKWAELVKERGNLPHDLQKRLPGQERGRSDKTPQGKSPGRPPMMPSPNSQQSVNQGNLAATSMASGLNFPGLGNLNNSLLSGLSLGNFDPKNNPLLMPFGGLPNLGALGSLGNLGNLGNMNSLFANLAGLGLPSLNMEALGAAASSTGQAETNVVSSSGTRNTNVTNTNSTSKSRSKMEPPTSKSSAPSTSTSSTLPTTTPFPFFFPGLQNPGLLYTPLGLGGLNPFTMQPGGVSSAYESLAQCGLLPPTSTASTSSTRKSSSSSASTNPTGSKHPRDLADILKRKEPEKKSRYTMDQAMSLSQYTDAALQAAAAASEERRRTINIGSAESDKKPITETIELGDIADLSARIERKTKEQEMKEALEQLSKTSAELFTRNLEMQQVSSKRVRTTPDRHGSEPHLPPSLEVTLEPIIKKPRVDTKEHSKDSEGGSSSHDNPLLPPPLKPPSRPPSSHREATNSSYSSRSPTPKIAATIEPVIDASSRQSKAPTPTPVSVPTSPSIVSPVSLVVPEPAVTNQSKSSPEPSPSATVTPVKLPSPEPSPPLNTSSGSNKESNESTSSQQPLEEHHASEMTTNSSNAPSGSDSNKSADSSAKPVSADETEVEESKGTKGKKARSAKRLNPEPPVERKNLRSSAGRQARAAAERQARSLLEGEKQAEQENHGSTE